MCEPTTLALAGLNAMSSISSIQNQNAAAVSNARNAKTAMNDSIAQEQLSFSERSRSLVQGGFDAILAGRAAEASAFTSAIENGVQGNSVKSMMRSARQATARSGARTQQELTSLSTQTGQNLKHIGTTTQGRINSVPTTRFGMGDLAGVLAPIVKAEME